MIRMLKSSAGRLATILLIVILFPGCIFVPSKFYHSPLTEIIIIDAKTKNAIDDAVIVVAWPLLTTGYAGGGSRAGSLALFEVVSDQGGKFEVPAWGPMKLPYDLRVDPRAPRIFVFKPGYLSVVLGSKHKPPSLKVSEINPSVSSESLESKWNGKVIELSPISNINTNFALNIEILEKNLKNVMGNWCTSVNNSKMTTAVNTAIQLIKDNNIMYRRMGFTRDCGLLKQ